jgi:predicted nuclease with RNAse H fold
MTTLPAVRLVGVDWSTQESKRGVAVVDVIHGSASLVELSGCNARRNALGALSAALTEAMPCVVAIDAPLGWPRAIAPALMEHSAGEGLRSDADAMFSRDTDRFVHQKLPKKKPLEVGANLIARTAHSANQFLRDLRKETSLPIPLLWSVEDLRNVGVIEVYPAATKMTVSEQSPFAALCLQDATVVCANAHVEDALWCAVAALHFVRGQCHLPADVDCSRREGWIWFKRPDA